MKLNRYLDVGVAKNDWKPNYRKKLRQMVADRSLYVLLLPAVVYVFIFSYLPMYGVLIAFKDFRGALGIWNSDWVGMKHFIRFITYLNFWEIVWNTFRISIYVLATFPCAIILALSMNELNNKIFKRTVQMVSYAPYFISTVVLCSIVKLFLNRESGVINNLIELLGGQRIAFLTIPNMFDSIYVWSGVWQGVGFGTIIYLAALSGISPELIDSAAIDGASRLKIIWHINLPTIMPTIVILLILSFGSLLGVGFEKIYLLQNDLVLVKSQVISTYVYYMGLEGGQYSYSAAIGLFNTVVNVTLLLIVNYYAKRATDIGIW